MADALVCAFCGKAWYLRDVDEWVVIMETPPDCDHEIVEEVSSG